MTVVKNILTVVVLLCVLVSCNQSTRKDGNTGDTAFMKTETQHTPYQNYGTKTALDDAFKTSQIQEKYASLKVGDTAFVKLEAPINAICKSKGCWMRLHGGDQEVFVKFKDYGFFVPLDASGDAIVEGKVFLEEVAVEELQYMAKDGGKSEAEITAITEPQHELGFIADGVLIKAN